jgi:hypothetical protein
LTTTNVTFTLDQASISRLQEAAARMPKSEVVRAAIAEYCDKLGRLGESERLRLLRALRRTIHDGSAFCSPLLCFTNGYADRACRRSWLPRKLLFPSEASIPFSWREAALSAKLYRSLHRVMGDRALNTADKDIPDLRLYISV